jgi:undecaprenyl-diphosphatase
VALVAALGLLAVFLLLAWDVSAGGRISEWDPRIERSVVEHRVAWLNALMRGVTPLGANVVLIPIVAAVAILLLFLRRDVRGALLAVAALAGADVLYQTAKPIIDRPRPPEALQLVGASNFSFPSGHATAATAAWGMVAILLVAGLPRPTRIALLTAAAVLVGLIAFSRVYLGVHWPSDAVGGVALGGAWIGLLWTVVLVAERRSRGSPA